MVSVTLAVREGLQGRAPEQSAGDDWPRAAVPPPAAARQSWAGPCFWPSSPLALVPWKWDLGWCPTFSFGCHITCWMSGGKSYRGLPWEAASAKRRKRCFILPMS